MKMKKESNVSSDMSRRSFLAGIASVGGLVATSRLPSFGGDQPELFPDRGRFERLSLTYHAIKAGATKPFTVLHISDTHLTAAYPDEGEFERKTAYRRRRSATPSHGRRSTWTTFCTPAT